MKNRFEDLDAWKKARVFRKDIYRVSKNFPKDELFALTNQIRRAACSVTANIAEGYGRFSFKEKSQFCLIARGSLNEALDQLYVALDEHYITRETFDELYAKGRDAEQVLNGYISFLRSKVEETR